MINAKPAMPGDIAAGNYTMFSPTAPREQPLLPDIGMGFTALVQMAHNVLINPDVAYRTDRRMQEQMLRDPVIIGPLTRRMLAVSQLKWQIVPDDENNPQEVEAASEIERLIRKMRRPTSFFKWLLMADWWGTSGAELNWQQEEGTNFYYPGSFRPHHGDKFLYDRWGHPRIQTRNQQTAGELLSQEDLSRLVIHTFDPSDGSFYEGAEAGYIFKGHGLRDRAWPFWFIKQESLKIWINTIERLGGGFALGRYPAGNAAAKSAIESVLRNLTSNSRVSVPVPAGLEDKDVFGIEVVNPSTSGQSTMWQDFCEGYCGKHLRILIQGQDQASQESGDGLGSGRAEALQGIFREYRNDSALQLADTMTAQVVGPMSEYNYPDDKPHLRFEFMLDGEDYDRTKSRIEAAKLAKLQIGRKWAHQALGIPMPDEGDDAIDLSDPLPGSDPNFSPLFGGHEDADKETHTLFKAALNEPA